METSTDDPAFGKAKVKTEMTSSRLATTPESSGETSSSSDEDELNGAPLLSEVRSSVQEPFKGEIFHYIRFSRIMIQHNFQAKSLISKNCKILHGLQHKLDGFMIFY